MIEIAKEYAEEGLMVVPLKKDKTPLINSDQFKYLYNVMPCDLIDKYFKDAEMIGISCGEIEAIDFDAHDNENIKDIFNEFISDVGVASILNNNNLPVNQET